MARILHKYFNKVFSITSFGDNIDTNDVNTNDASTGASIVDTQDTMKDDVGNNENVQVFH